MRQNLETNLVGRTVRVTMGCPNLPASNLAMMTEHASRDSGYHYWGKTGEIVAAYQDAERSLILEVLLASGKIIQLSTSLIEVQAVMPELQAIVELAKTKSTVQ
jgi:hypothetical protein